MDLTQTFNIENMEKNNWIKVSNILPTEGEVVETKIDEGGKVRNEGVLRRIGRLWYLPNRSMYVYYTPTHWRPLNSPSK